MSRKNGKKTHTHTHIYMGGFELQRAYYRVFFRLVFFIFGLRVPDDGTVTFYREIKFKMGFVVVHCCYYDKIYLQLIDMGGLRLQRVIETDIP